MAAPEFDVVIVGAGMAGALCAYKLSARTDLKILLLDAGENLFDDAQRAEFVKVLAVASGKGVVWPYSKLPSVKSVPNPDPNPKDGKDVHLVEAGPDIFKSNYLRIVGGSTWAWRGNVPRYIPSDFRLKSIYGVGEDWPLTYCDLEPYYCQAEIELGVSGNHDEWQDLLGAHRSRPFPMPNIVQSYGDRLVKARLDGLTLDVKTVHVVSTPQARNSQPYDGRSACQGNANCIPVCPSGAKYDAGVHLRKALANGVQLKTRAVACRLQAESDGTVSTVIFKDWKDPDLKEQSVTAKTVVLALHGIETPRLWLLSNLGNRSDQVGRNLMDHLAEEVVGLFPEPIYPFRGPQNTSSIEDFRDGPFRAAHGAFRMSIGNDGWGRRGRPADEIEKLAWKPESKTLRKFGESLKYAIEDRITRMFRLSYSTEQLPSPDNRVTLDKAQLDPLGIPRPKIAYAVDDYSKRALVYGQDIARRLFRSIVGAEEIQPREPNLEYNGAGHIMGTCRMGTDPDTSVVDPFGRSHEHPNLFVLGSSVFVTGSTGNPTLTAAALTLRTTEVIQSTL